jgi:hypothetical protein
MEIYVGGEADLHSPYVDTKWYQMASFKLGMLYHLGEEAFDKILPTTGHESPDGE